MKQALLHLALLACLPATALAQTPARPAPTAAGLKRDFAIIEAGTEGESEDFDKLTAATARQLVTYLKTHEVTAAGAKSLGLDYAEAKGTDHLKAFSYSYASGGTRGTIHRPVLQWRNAAGQLFAYAMAEEAGFYAMYPLASPGRALYLLLGGDKGDASCDMSQARVVELKGNYLLLDTPAFNKQPALNLCNVNFDFDAARQVLHLDLRDYSTGHDERLPPEWERPRAKSLDLKFSNNHFVKSQ